MIETEENLAVALAKSIESARTITERVVKLVNVIDIEVPDNIVYDYLIKEFIKVDCKRYLNE